MYVYLIKNNLSDGVYVGITRASLKKRFSAHKTAANRGNKSILYDAMRAYGIDNFSIELLKVCDSEEDLLSSEKQYVKYYRDLLGKTYNILDGGESYFPIVDTEAWKNKLKSARVGRTPAKGMKHSGENRELFKKVSNEYWSTQDTYNAEEITKLTYKEAKALYGISKTHFYRLKNELGIPSKKFYTPEDILSLPLNESIIKFGITKRHYQALKRKHIIKQAGSNESC